MIRTDHTIWCEKYRPNTMEGYIGNEHFISKLNQYIEQNDISNICLVGSAGTGKCLDYSEEIDIEIELTPDEFIKLQNFLIK